MRSTPSPASDAAPSPARGERIGVLATLPVFFKLHGRRVLLIGGGKPAVWKAELLAAAGADVHVHAGEHSDAMRALAAAPAAGRIILKPMPWGPDDLPGAALAIGDFADKAQAAAFAAIARAAGIPVNVIDKPEFCDFQFGALVNRSPLVVAISTDGAAPVFGQAIRARIEMLLPAGFQRWAEAAKTWRARFQSDALGDPAALAAVANANGNAPDFRTRRRFWEAFAGRALDQPDRAPAETDYAACFAAARPAEPGAAPAIGRVAMVTVAADASGAGAAESLTLKAVRLLGAADIVVHDTAVPASVLDFARREARRIAVGDGRAGPLLVGLARDGKQIVRVSLEPASLLDAERRALQAAGVEPDIVPGITRQPSIG